jgi:hypothetical protein
MGIGAVRSVGRAEAVQRYDVVGWCGYTADADRSHPVDRATGMIPHEEGVGAFGPPVCRRAVS